MRLRITRMFSLNPRAKKIFQTLLLCLGASTIASISKLLFGYYSHSLAFTADGIHSLFDSAATILGMISIAQSAKPPDENHPYGHRKFETVSALALGFLLFLAAYEVGSVAFHRIIAAPSEVHFSYWGLAILFFTMVINLSTAYLEAKRAKELDSNFLKADSLHNQSDFLITCAVLVSLLSAKFQWNYVDAVISLAITLYLVYLSFHLIWSNIHPLVDRSVLDVKKVERIAQSVDGVLHCHHVRSRGEPGHYFLDLNLHLPGHISLDRAHEIGHLVEAKLKVEFPGLVDVVIHTEPDGHAPCCLILESSTKPQTKSPMGLDLDLNSHD